MIIEVIKDSEYFKTILQEHDKEIQIERRQGTQLIIRSDYKVAYGMGEKFNALNQKGKTVQNQVIEKFCNQNEASYFVTPFFVTDAGFGIFIDTKEKTQFIFQENISCEIPSNASVTIFTGTMEEIIQDYIRLTGIPKMPPEYAFGVWISANWWNCQSVVEEQIEKLKKYQFPASVIVIEAWSDEATFYIWNGAVNTPETEGITLEEFDFSKSSQWPDPKGMIDRLHHAGLKLVLWQIPVFKKQDNDEIISEQLSLDKEYAVRHQLCVMNQDGSPYEIPEGNWFAGSYIPDFTREETKEFWFHKRKYLLDMGVDGFKTDGGEFIYRENILFADGTTGKEGKNQYCQDYINAYHDFITDQNVLFSRAGYVGASKTPILWAGDHQSTNQELKNVLIAGLSAAMSGVIFWSFDIGGFAGDLPSMDLYLRSTQLACFCPIMQWHSEPLGGQFKELMSGMDSNNERSPWNMVSYYKCPELITEIKFWHDLRMMLMPFIYSLAQESVFTCKPMMRPMGYVCQKDERCLAISDQYFFGENMIVAPLLEENQRQRELYLPEGSWFGFFSRKRYDGECDLISDEQEKFPVYIKSGTTILLHVEQNFKLLLFGENGEDTLNIENQRIQITWEEGKVIMKGGEGINLMCEFVF